MATELIVTNGPSKWDLMLALFDSEHDRTRSVTFTVQGSNWPTTATERERRSPEEKFEAELYDRDMGPHEIEVVIDGVEHDTGDGESWKISGYIKDSNDEDIEGFYSTRRRRGRFEIVAAEVPRSERLKRREAHLRMGTERVLDDLDKKYSRGTVSEERCHRCKEIIDTREDRVLDGQFVICTKCDDELSEMARQDEEAAFDNEDPLEGAVEPVGGRPSDRTALRHFDDN